MINHLRSDLLVWVQASLGWAMLAARAAPLRLPVAPTVPASPDPLGKGVPLRATITIDIDARDRADAEWTQAEIRAQFDRLAQALPTATLQFQRRKPRTGRRAPRPPVVVSPYVDD